MTAGISREPDGAANRLAPRAAFLAGGAHLDRRARSERPYEARCSNPGSTDEIPGGAIFNAGLALRALACPVAIESARAGDAAGRGIAEAIEARGMRDLSVTWLDRRTPSYTALLDADGELVGAVADMALYDKLVPRLFTRVHTRAEMAKADFLMLDANLPGTTIAALARAADGRPVGVIGVSPAKVTRLREALPWISALFVSKAEAIALLDDAAARTDISTPELARRLARTGIAHGVVTDGPRDCAIFEGSTTAVQRPPAVAAHDVKDVTGAGDTLAAVAMLAFANGAEFHEAARLGLVAASVRVATPAFPPRDFAARLEAGFADLPLSRLPESTE